MIFMMTFSPASDNEMKSDNLAQSLAMMIFYYDFMMISIMIFMIIFIFMTIFFMTFSPASDNEMKSDNLARSLAMMEDELKRAEERVKIAEERVSELNSIRQYS